MIIEIVICMLLMMLIVGVWIGWNNTKEEKGNQSELFDSISQSTHEKRNNPYVICQDIITGEVDDVKKDDVCISMGIMSTKITTYRFNTYWQSTHTYIDYCNPYIFIDNIMEYKWLWEDFRLDGGHILKIKNLIKAWKESGLKTKDEVYRFMFERRFNKTEEDKGLDVCVRIDDEYVKFDFRKQFGDNYNRIFYENLLNADNGLQINYSNCSHFRRMENDYIYSENNVPVKVYSKKDIEDKIKFYGEKG